jgi:YgiT-type zinc finger domain-containing protein
VVGYIFKKDNAMKCAICRNGETVLKNITVTLERAGTTLVIKDVPADVCTNCGEEYVSAKTNRELLQRAENTVARGVDLELMRFAA